MPEELDTLRINIILPEDFDDIVALAPKGVDVKKREKVKKWVERAFKNLECLKLNLGGELNAEEFFGLEQENQAHPDKVFLCIYSKDKIKLSSFNAVLGNITFKPSSNKKEVERWSQENNGCINNDNKLKGSYTYTECLRLRKILKKSKNGLRKAFSATLTTISGKTFRQIRPSELDMFNYYKPYIVDRNASSRPFLKQGKFPDQNRHHSEMLDDCLCKLQRQVSGRLLRSRTDTFRDKDQGNLSKIKFMINVDPVKFNKDLFLKEMVAQPLDIHIASRRMIYSYNEVEYYAQKCGDNCKRNGRVDPLLNRKILHNVNCLSERSEPDNSGSNLRKYTHKKHSLKFDAPFHKRVDSRYKLSGRREQKGLKRDKRFALDKKRSRIKREEEIIGKKPVLASDVAVQVTWRDDIAANANVDDIEVSYSITETSVSLPPPDVTENNNPNSAGPSTFVKLSPQQDDGRVKVMRSVSIQADQNTLLNRFENLGLKMMGYTQQHQSGDWKRPTTPADLARYSTSQAHHGLDRINHVYDRHRCLLQRCQDKHLGQDNRCFDKKYGQFHFEGDNKKGKSHLKYCTKMAEAEKKMHEECFHNGDKQQNIFKKIFTKSKYKKETERLRRYRKMYIEEESDLDGDEPAIVKIKFQEGLRKIKYRGNEGKGKSNTKVVKNTTGTNPDVFCDNCGLSLFSNRPSYLLPTKNKKKRKMKVDSLTCYKSLGKILAQKYDDVNHVSIENDNSKNMLLQNPTVENAFKMKYNDLVASNQSMEDSTDFSVRNNYRRKRLTASHRQLSELKAKRRQISACYFIYRSNAPPREHQSVNIINKCKKILKNKLETDVRQASNKCKHSQHERHFKSNHLKKIDGASTCKYPSTIPHRHRSSYSHWESDQGNGLYEDDVSLRFIGEIKENCRGIRNLNRRSTNSSRAFQYLKRRGNPSRDGLYFWSGPLKSDLWHGKGEADQTEDSSKVVNVIEVQSTACYSSQSSFFGDSSASSFSASANSLSPSNQDNCDDFNSISASYQSRSSFNPDMKNFEKYLSSSNVHFKTSVFKNLKDVKTIFVLSKQKDKFVLREVEDNEFNRKRYDPNLNYKSEGKTVFNDNTVLCDRAELSLIDNKVPSSDTKQTFSGRKLEHCYDNVSTADNRNNHDMSDNRYLRMAPAIAKEKVTTLIQAKTLDILKKTENHLKNKKFFDGAGNIIREKANGLLAGPGTGANIVEFICKKSKDNK